MKLQPLLRTRWRSHRIDVGLVAGLVVAWAVGIAIALKLAA